MLHLSPALFEITGLGAKPSGSAPETADFREFGLDPAQPMMPNHDGHDPASGDRAAVLARKPVGQWTASDTELMLEAFPGQLMPLQVALVMLATDPLTQAGDRPGDLLLAAARSAMPDRVATGNRDLAPVREMLWRHLVEARATLRRELEAAMEAASLSGSERIDTRQRIESGWASDAERPFAEQARLAEILTEIRLTLAPPRILFTATHRKAGPEPTEIDRQVIRLFPAGKNRNVETTFIVLADGGRVRLCHFDDDGNEVWNGPTFRTPLDAINHARKIHRVPETAWHSMAAR